MATNVLALKKEAVKLGMNRDEAKRANRKQLEDFIANAGKAPAKKNVKKKSSPAKVAKKTGAAKKKTGKPERKKPVEKAQRKKTEKAPAAKKSGKKSGEAKRPSRKPRENTGVGRASLGKINWNKTSPEWNPKKGGPVERLFKALKKRNGNVDKAFDDLKGSVWDFVGKKLRNGEKRSQKSAHAMLRYRLNRTKFEFAVRTGQHESATDRVEYGTGTYASERRKKPGRKKAENKPARKPAAKKQTRKPASKKPAKTNTKNKKRSKR